MKIDGFEEKIADAVRLLKVISNESRLQILCSLLETPLTVSEINQQIDLSQSALSQHLAKLRALELVDTTRDGLNIYYSVSKPVVAKLLKALQEEFCQPNSMG